MLPARGVDTRASALELWARRRRRGVLTSAAALLGRRQEVDPRRFEREEDVAHASCESARKAAADQPSGIADVDGERLDAVDDGRAEVGLRLGARRA